MSAKAFRVHDPGAPAEQERARQDALVERTSASPDSEVDRSGGGNIRRLGVVFKCRRDRTGWDIDNLDTKAVLDGMVEAGVLLRDDVSSIAWIAKVDGGRCESGKEETKIEVWEGEWCL